MMHNAIILGIMQWREGEPLLSPHVSAMRTTLMCQPTCQWMNLNVLNTVNWSFLRSFPGHQHLALQLHNSVTSYSSSTPLRTWSCKAKLSRLVSLPRNLSSSVRDSDSKFSGSSFSISEFSSSNGGAISKSDLSFLPPLYPNYPCINNGNDSMYP